MPEESALRDPHVGLASVEARGPVVMAWWTASGSPCGHRRSPLVIRDLASGKVFVRSYTTLCLLASSAALCGSFLITAAISRAASGEYSSP